jgi:hypothetical protein
VAAILRAITYPLRNIDTLFVPFVNDPVALGAPSVCRPEHVLPFHAVGRRTSKLVPYG